MCKTHWSKIDDKFEEPEVSAAEKEALKQHLPVALSDPSNHIRTTAVREKQDVKKEVWLLNESFHPIMNSSKSDFVSLYPRFLRLPFDFKIAAANCEARDDTTKSISQYKFHRSLGLRLYGWPVVVKNSWESEASTTFFFLNDNLKCQMIPMIRDRWM